MFGHTINPPSIISIVENACRNVEIASATQVLTLEDWFVAPSPRQAFTVDPVILETLLQPAQLSPDQESWWREALEACHQDALISLLLLKLPNLRKLEIKNMRTGSPYLKSILSRLVDTNDPLTGLSQLSELIITPKMFGYDFFLSDFILFTQLPSLRKFRLVGAIDHYQPPPPEEGEEHNDPPSTTPETHRFHPPSHLTHLTLHASNALTTLSTLLPHLPHLQSLVYNHHDPAIQKSASESIRRLVHATGHNTSMGWGISRSRARYLDSISKTSTLNPAVLHPGLAQAARPSLQALWITTSHRLRQNPTETFTQDLPGIPIGDLHGFSALKQVRMRIENLLTVERNEDRTVKATEGTLWEVLPGCLEAVFLEECDREILPEVVRQLRRMVESREQEQQQQDATIFPALRKVVLQQPTEERDRIPFQFPENMTFISQEMMQRMARHRMAENDIQPDVYAELMGLKDRFAVMGVTLRVANKMGMDAEGFPLKLD
ncbi:hypothetical protein BO71DRAFT_398941 [Aspergillus ellipticus CBS 707.79]|uniref:Leucine-rich repeat domain-containing protein n=1 Tax=Aspergillus ellipticus CBS 707.79 TaxID=1448320 RepID=A0A319E1E2_9EURO|nr:hypothetical protein BO71DRAFT_398941 [Aspergillus ellipticus CBS 707.79]